MCVTVGGRGVVHIADVEHRFGREQEKVFGRLLFVFAFEGDGACRFALFQSCFVLQQHVVFQFGLFVTAHLGHFFHAFDAVFNSFQILEL